jgi:diguanylate cyclase (GGDEF)-like protein
MRASVRDNAERRGAFRVAALTLALGIACLAAVPLLGDLPAIHPIAPIGFALIAALFAVSEVIVIHVPLRRDTHTSSFSEVPLTLGLFVLAPLQLGVAAVIGTTSALVLHRRQRGVKLMFNVSEVGAQALLATATFRVLYGHTSVGSTRAFGAAIAAVLAADLASALLVNSAIGLFRGRWPGIGAFELLGGLVSCTAKAALALLGVVAVSDGSPAGLAMVAICGLTMYVAFYAYAAVHERHVRLEMLYRFSSSVGASVKLDEIAGAVVTEARDVLRASTAELAIRSDEGTATIWRATGDGSAVSETVVAEACTGELWESVAAGTALVSGPDALAIGLGLHTGAQGYLLVQDRLGVEGDFDSVDCRLFEALANQAAVALANGDLVEQLEAEMQAREYRATHDPLTGLLNRVAFSDALDATLSTDPSRRALFVLGLDRFSQVNETLGHDHGDLVLAEVCSRLASAIHGSIVGRLGGDELAILSPPIAADADIRTLSDQLVGALRRGIAIEGLQLEVGASIGAAVAPDDADNGIALLRFADTAMREAKVRRSAFERYRGNGESDTRRRLVLAHELRRAIDESQLVVYYQPKLDLASGRVTGVEALVRWPHPHHGLIPPDDFVPIAEHTGLIEGLTTVVLEKTLAQRRLWAASGVVLSVAVNVSARSLSDQRFPDQIARMLVRHRCPPDALTIEITESQLMADPDGAARVLGALHDLGVRVSIDDLGTGFSSLSSLRALPLDEVKIDKSFVFGVTSSESDAAIVRSMTALGTSLGLGVVAEGVEDAETEAFLIACGVQTVQGFFYARPQPAEVFEAWLRERRPVAVLVDAGGFAS